MNTITIKFDYKFVSSGLLLVIIVMLALWQPWDGLTTRTVVVSGQATVQAEPDQFTFYPTYQETSKTSSAAISAVSAKGNAVVKKLVTLGIPENKITTNVNSGDYYGIKGDEASTGETAAIFNITAVTGDKKIAQEVLDYLAGTDPLYGVSPQSSFATETRRQLENDARQLALADAKSRADQTAQELGVKIGNVMEVSEPNWGGIIPLGVEGRATTDSAAPEVQTSPKLLTGEQEVTYQISV
ncbi:MAG: SIMPL domain-containing protein, partial [Patescibacteria group bacterium]